MPPLRCAAQQKALLTFGERRSHAALSSGQLATAKSQRKTKAEKIRESTAAAAVVAAAAVIAAAKDDDEPDADDYKGRARSSWQSLKIFIRTQFPAHN